jgi:endogenous inhibitor of DNA gyrase (YacG/DUF329 family)
MKPLKVKCPHCKKEFEYYSSDFRPFCTERCKMVDLGHWLEESYTVPAQNLTQEEQDNLSQLVEEPNEEQ